jgi:hypothetical protein
LDLNAHADGVVDGGPVGLDLVSTAAPFRANDMPSAANSIVSRVNVPKARQKRVDFVTSFNRKINRARD